MSDLLLAYLTMVQLLINTTEFALLDANKELQQKNVLAQSMVPYNMVAFLNSEGCYFLHISGIQSTM